METRLGCPHLAQGQRVTVSAGHTGVQVTSELVSFEMELEIAMIGLWDV